MEESVRRDILKLYRANPLLRDTPQVIANRIGRSVPDVEQALKELEAEGVVSVRWVGGVPMHFFTGSPAAARGGSADSQIGWADEANAATPARKKGIPPFKASIQVPSDLDGVHTARAAVEALCRVLGMDSGASMEFAIAVSEALTNAYRYGRRGDGRDVIAVTVGIEESQVVVTVKDRGSGFPFILVGSSQVDGKSTGGRGLMLMRSLADSLDVRRTSRGTIVTIKKTITPAPKS